MLNYTPGHGVPHQAARSWRCCRARNTSLLASHVVVLHGIGRAKVLCRPSLHHPRLLLNTAQDAVLADCPFLPIPDLTTPYNQTGAAKLGSRVPVCLFYSPVVPLVELDHSNRV